MKRLPFASTFFFLSFFLIVGCIKPRPEHCKPEERPTDNPKISNTFKVKVERRFCAYTILSIQDPEYYSKGIDWDNLQHVFSVGNFCDLPANLVVGEAYQCEIIDKPIIENCNVCMGFMETPPIKYNVLLTR
jgi:hypothetical protein